MREEMFIAPSFLKTQVASTTNAPVLAMTIRAIVKPAKKKGLSGVEETKRMCSIQFSPTTTISTSLSRPPQSHICEAQKTSN